jgi:hypothetical protein
VACGCEGLRGVAAYITCSACDEDVHEVACRVRTIDWRSFGPLWI